MSLHFNYEAEAKESYQNLICFLFRILIFFTFLNFEFDVTIILT